MVESTIDAVDTAINDPAIFGGEYADIPLTHRAALMRYILNHIKPGDFLTAVLSNDLRNAVNRADATVSLPLLRTYVRWLCWAGVVVPHCHGSREAVEAWVGHPIR